MKITHIHHSGFLVETEEVYYIFDYYKGDLPCLTPEKPVLVFVSHGHQDHYNPAIFPLLLSKGMKNITAVISNDIPRKKIPAELVPASQDGFDQIPVQGHIPFIKVYHSQEYVLPYHTRIQTLLSTDSGVAFLLTCPEGTIYHGGDLNDWITEDTPEGERRQMTGMYLASIKQLKGNSIDAAFLPLDPRLGKYYAKGFLAFLEFIPVKHVYPMHYWEQPEIVTQFLNEHPEYAEIVVAPSP